MAYIGYIRVSSEEQNDARQMAALESCPYKIDKLFSEKISGKNTDRPQLKAMLSYIREGDTVIVTEFSRLARSCRDLLRIVDEITAKQTQLISLKENVDTSTPAGQFMLTVFAAMAELERSTILDRQREGIAIAKANGKYKGRQPIPFDEERFKSECCKWRKGEQTAVATMRKFDMKPNRFYRLVKQRGL